MSGRTQIVAGEYYHIYNRGNNRQPIFFNIEDYGSCLKKLRMHLVGDNPTLRHTDIIAYCLMPNHYHLMVHTLDGSFLERIRRFSIAYTKSINARYGRVGALFQGRFKADHVDSDTYLTHLSRYIHLNPVAAGLASQAEDWAFSSYREYLGIRNGTLPRPDIVLAQFPSRQAYREFIDDYAPDDSRTISHLLFDE